jgi:chromosome partitioning protein
MGKILTVAIRKGGSGKTTTAVNVASALQLTGHRTLLVDLDQSANATMHVGINPYTLPRSMATLFRDFTATPQSVMQVTNFGLSVLPATGDLEDVEAGMKAPQIGVLKLIFGPIVDQFEYIVVDTPPSHSYLSLSALVASDYVLIPLEPHYLAMDGLAKIMNDISQVKQGLNPQLTLLGIVPVKVQERTNIAQTILREVQNAYGNLVLPCEIRFSVKHAEASLVGQPILLYDPRHEGAKEYYALTEVIYGKTK